MRSCPKQQHLALSLAAAVLGARLCADSSSSSSSSAQARDGESQGACTQTCVCAACKLPLLTPRCWPADCAFPAPAQVPVRIQPTHLLCRRWPTPAGAPPEKKKPQHSGSESGEDTDAGEDEQQAAAATPAACKKSNAVTGRCSKAGMQQHKAALAAAAAAADEDGDGEDGQREAIANPAHLDAVATAAQASDGQFGYEHLEEPLSLFDFHRCVRGLTNHSTQACQHAPATLSSSRPKLPVSPRPQEGLTRVRR